MKKIVKSTTLGVILILLILISIAQLSSKEREDIVQLSKTQENETKQVTTGVGTETELSKWEYYISTNNSIVLTKYIGTDTDIIIYSKYTKDGTTYPTVVYNHVNSSTVFEDVKTTLKTVTFQNNVKIESHWELFASCKALTKVDFGGAIFGSTKADNMFNYCTSLTTVDFNASNTEGITSANYMFNGCSSLSTINWGSFTAKNITGMSNMFDGCESITELDINNWDVSNVTYMDFMFRCTALTNINISNWNTSKLENMNYMFYGCSSLTTAKIFQTMPKRMVGVFESCNNLTSVNVENWDTSKSIDLSSIFEKCSSLTSLNLSNFNTSSVKYMDSMFTNCSSLISLNLSSFDTGSVTTMETMFSGCSSLTSLNLSSFDTSSVTDMTSMFANCSLLTNLNLSNFDTSSVTTMESMFSNCSSLTSLNLSNFDTSKVTSMRTMFYNCKSIESLDLSNFNTSKVTNMYYMFYNCSALPSLDLSSFDMTNVSTYTNMLSACNFDTLVTPKVGLTSVSLPYTMYTEDKTEYTSLPTTSLTLYKELQTSEYTVTFVNEGITVDTQTVEEGNAATAPNLSKPGYTLSWDKDFSSVTSDLIVNAIWTANTNTAYKVEHYKQNTTLNGYDLVTEDTENLTETTDTTVTSTAKTYIGFTENTTHSDRVESGTVAGDGSLVLKLYYDRNSYTVTLNTNEGAINSGNITSYTYGVGANLPTDVTKTGYTFEGWYENSPFSGSAVTSISTTDIGNKEYFAKWTINQYTVTFKNGETVEKTETVDYGLGATAPDLSKAGYTLSWDKDFSNVTSDLTVNAIWTANTDTAYKVEHYQRTPDLEVEGYSLFETENLSRNNRYNCCSNS